MLNELILPCVEPRRCLLISLEHGFHLSTNKDGSVVSKKDASCPSAEWLILPNGSLAQRHPDGKVVCLSISGSGKVCATGNLEDVASSTCKIKLVNEGSSVQGGQQFMCELVQGKQAIWCLTDGTITCRPTFAAGRNTTWTIEMLSGELCFLSNQEKQLHCSLFGAAKMVDKREGWEVWRLVEVGDGTVVIMSFAHNKALCSNKKGEVYTKERDEGCQGEIWRVERSGWTSGIWIRSVATQRYLCFDSNKQDRVHTTFNPSPHTLWTFEAANQNTFHIMNTKNQEVLHVAAEPKDAVLASSAPSKMSKWQLKRHGDGYCILLAAGDAQYLGCVNGMAQLIGTSAKTTWYLHPDQDGIRISVDKIGKYCLGANGQVSPAGSNPLQLWQIEPCMPTTMTGSQAKAMLGAGTVAVAAVAFAPFAVMGAISALGFTSQGIAAGSVAAGMMSAEATALGGGVAAGGTVATLQSIGAVGLGVAGTCAASGAGALVGAAVVGSTQAVFRKSLTQNGVLGVMSNDEDDDSPSVDHRFANRPFAAWRSWSQAQS